MLPPSHLESLAREHLGSLSRLARARHIEDPDAFRGARSAPPVAVSMALRRLVTGGPIGALRSRHSHSLNPGGDGPAIADPQPVEPGRLPGTRAGSTADDEAERPIAA
jgi:hypothetical protein